MATLYRCRAPTNWLCPCGRVERELRRHDVPHDTVRVPWRRSDRAEVRALSGQGHVPLVVLDGEAICDSHRIVEHLRWRGLEDDQQRDDAGRGERAG
ncbi:MAG: glutaredoxin [Solirubrobacterales bacterium]|nr:glutaredoxin [Solirubrobacterales bacterium]